MGLNYQDRMNIDNPNKHIASMIYTNPCSEFSNIPFSSCNLGSINLVNFVNNGKSDLERLKTLAYNAIRWFDNMISVNILPLSKIQEVTNNIRPIGMGIMGLADMMYKLGIRYDSGEGKKLAEEIISTIKSSALEGSIDLAKERGVYPAWEGSEWQKKNIKIRNSSLLSIAPTGSIAFIAGVSGGCEPNYGLVYNRRTYGGNIYYIVNPIFEETLKEANIYSEEVIEKIFKNNGSCKGIKEIPQDIQNIFVVASDISPEDHVSMVAILQNKVDLSISKTCNFNKSAAIKDISDIFMYAWRKGLKGITVYRDGCRENQTLSTGSSYVKKDEEKSNQYDFITPKSKDEIGETYGTNIKKKVACGNLYINLCRNSDGELVECFINVGKDGICQSNINAISRLISLSLRSGLKVEEMVDQLSGINCPACSILKSQGKDIESSCPSAIGNYLSEKYAQGNSIVIKETKGKKKFLDPNPKDIKTLCPTCGEKLRMESGCVTCSCGFSKCN